MFQLFVTHERVIIIIFLSFFYDSLFLQMINHRRWMVKTKATHLISNSISEAAAMEDTWPVICVFPVRCAEISLRDFTMASWRVKGARWVK